MHESNETLAQETTAFCERRVERRPARLRRPRIAEAVLGIVVAALLASRQPSGPCWHQ